MKYNEDFKLSDKHYFDTEFEKIQIVVGNSLNSQMKHVGIWNTILNGESKYTTPFTISTDGTIYKHYEPSAHSHFVHMGHLDRKVIGITLENEGCLWKDVEKKHYVNWIGDIYNRKGKVVDVKWRDREYWAPYSAKQITSLARLCKSLCKEFNINPEVIHTNTVVSDAQEFQGIMFRSNFSKYYYDVSPAFDIVAFKNKIESK